MKKFTTSAQKTLELPKNVILKKLEEEMTRESELVFVKTKSDNIRKAKLKDGSTNVIASFDKENGKTLAMIDHKDLSEDYNRTDIQTKLRKKLDKLFGE
ncbi:MAG: hypothetical protein M3040_11140 [Bacteroidota bacterium]|nr:hypothetical protein [Bacteroidota bacterium]